MKKKEDELKKIFGFLELFSDKILKRYGLDSKKIVEELYRNDKRTLYKKLYILYILLDVISEEIDKSFEELIRKKRRREKKFLEAEIVG